jgi:hypothetical protein
VCVEQYSEKKGIRSESTSAYFDWGGRLKKIKKEVKEGNKTLNETLVRQMNSMFHEFNDMKKTFRLKPSNTSPRRTLTVDK